MKNRQILMGILVIVSVFGLVFGGCEQPTESGEEDMTPNRKEIIVTNITGWTGRAGIWVFENMPNNTMPNNTAVGYGTIVDGRLEAFLTVPSNNFSSTSTYWTGEGEYYIAIVPFIVNGAQEELDGNNAKVYIGDETLPVKVDIGGTTVSLEFDKFKNPTDL
jgi:hypothetical protein